MLRRLVPILFYLLASFTTAQISESAVNKEFSTFRVGTLTYADEGETTGVGTLTMVFHEGHDLLGITAPDGSSLFQEVANPIGENLFGTSPLAPVSGTYTATFNEGAVVLEARLESTNTLDPATDITVQPEGEQVTVSWTPVSRAKAYEVILMSVKDSETVARLEAREPSASLPVSLLPGEYFAVVRAYDFTPYTLPLPAAVAASESRHIFTEN